MKSLYHILLFVLLFCYAVVIHAGDISELGHPAFRVFTDKDGLPQNTILAMAVDQKGYLWIGTQDAAAYYNGRKWTRVALPNRTISSFAINRNAILAASDGSLWFGSDGGGLAHYVNGKWTTVDTSNGLAGNTVWQVIETKSEGGGGAIWAATDGGLSKFEQDTWTTIHPRSDKPDDKVRALLETSSTAGQPTLWVGLDEGGLVQYQANQWKTVATHPVLPSNKVLCLLETHPSPGESAVWVGTGKGPALHQKGHWRTFNDPASLPNQPVLSLLETNSGTRHSAVWVGTPYGLARLQNERWTAFDTRHGLPHNAVLSLLEIRPKNGEGSLWIGTDSGLARVSENKWTSFNVSSGLPDKLVSSFLESRDEHGKPTFWVGTFNGLARYQEDRWTIFDRTNTGLPQDSNIILSLLETGPDKGGRILWVGTWGGGIAKCQDGRWTTIDHNSGLADDTVNCLLETTSETGESTLWAGTAKGLSYLENGHWKTVDAQSGLRDVNVSSLLLTRTAKGKATLWVGTKGKGVFYRQDGRWKALSDEFGLQKCLVLGLRETRAEDGKRWLWIGTKGYGVLRMALEGSDGVVSTTHRQFYSDRSVPNIPNNVVYQIQQDRQHRIYLFTNQGIARLTPRTPTKEDPAEYSVYTFTTEDGLAGLACNRGASMVDSQGRIWGGTLEGAVMLDPSKEILDRSSKPLYIERAELLGKAEHLSLAASPSMLRYNENHLAFEFSLLSYLRAGDTRYRTLLVGRDEAPSPWTADARVEYFNLAKGDYLFRVWAKDYAGNISGPVEAAFTVQQAPWKTWWAYLLYLVIFVVGAYLLAQWRTRLLQRRNKALEARVRERTEKLEETLREKDGLTSALRELAVRDPLTHLYNRRYFLERAHGDFALIRREKKAIAILMMDLDRFKAINDHYGHPTGDEVLREVTAALRTCVRETDLIVRYGGEEFLLVLFNSTEEGAMRLAETIRHTLESTPLTSGVATIRVTISIGLRWFDSKVEPAVDLDQLIEQADRALYQAKRDGRNKVVVYDKNKIDSTVA
ncbi:MAG: diguanylate cyclase [Acidobacteria bacterium]|nr:diguanylate cyclase [Acidobacteriota bacterium]